MVNIFIFGDSHTRSYRNFQNIYPFFFGQGKEYCIEKPDNIISQIKTFFKLYQHIVTEKDLFFLSFGEPDCRILVNGDYHVFQKDKDGGFEYDPKKTKHFPTLMKNFGNIVETLEKFTQNWYIITPITAYPPTLPYLTVLNEKLKETFDNKIIDLYSRTFNENGKIKTTLSDNIGYDPIHLNEKLCILFLHYLKEYNIILPSSKYPKRKKGDVEKFKFKKHKKFKTYILK